jgi:RNA polymerase sigma-70 factor (ECF subfamily)
LTVHAAEADTGAGVDRAVEDRDWWLAVHDHGDQRAFEQLYLRYCTPLARFVLRHTPLATEDAAKDVVHETFARLWLARADIDITGTVRAYLYRAVRNRALTTRRGDGRAERHAARLAALGEVVAMGARPLDPGQALEHRERAIAIGAALDQLSPRRRQVAEMRWMDQLGPGEIAEILGISSTTVSNLLTSARNSVKKALFAAYPTAGDRRPS